MVPATYRRSAEAHAYGRDFVRHFGIKRFHDVGPEQGISHAVVADHAYALPGTVLVCSDSHTCASGAFNCAARGIGAPDLLASTVPALSALAELRGIPVTAAVLALLALLISRLQRRGMLLPLFLLSGFFFPFAGMPGWAQVIGSLVPVTHFLRIVRGSLLKGQGIADAWPSLVALMLFVLGVSVLAMLRYRTTLD